MLPLGIGETPRLVHDLTEQLAEVAQLAEQVSRHLQQGLVLLLQGELSLECQGVGDH